MVAGATFAYFTSTANKVTNTFVSGGFGTVYLQEKDGGSTQVDPFTGTQTKANSYTVIPGKNINKDPKVSLDMDDDQITNAYLYVKMTYGKNWVFSQNTNDKTVTFNGTIKETSSALSFTIASNWYLVKHVAATGSADGYIVLCYGSRTKGSEVKADVTATSIFTVSEGSTITVSNGLTETDCEWFRTAANVTSLKLGFSAYAIQAKGFTVDNGWTEAQKLGG
jgi:predicted ribosomally synthesized peptide with SipW-like signal peptide